MFDLVSMISIWRTSIKINTAFIINATRESTRRGLPEDLRYSGLRGGVRENLNGFLCHFSNPPILFDWRLRHCNECCNSGVSHSSHGDSGLSVDPGNSYPRLSHSESDTGSSIWHLTVEGPDQMALQSVNHVFLPSSKSMMTAWNVLQKQCLSQNTEEGDKHG